MTDDLSAVFEAPIGAPPAIDDLVTATMRWHFSQETGSVYWLKRLPDLGFDPISDVRSFADLALFDNVDVDFSTVPATELVPAGCRERRFGVYESGGTTGAPKRVVDAT